MRPATITAFVDELVKIAAGPKVVHDPELLTGGQYWRPSFIDKVDREHPERGVKAMVGKKHGLLIMTPREQLVAAHPELGGPAYAGTRRHEMTHWMRDRRGKMEGMGKPGLRNVLRTAREEGAAYLSEGKAYRNSPAMMKHHFGTLPSRFFTSMGQNYPHGVGQAAMGGTFGKIVKPIAGLAKRFIR